jgi:YegS/Rv2252/BmrU family lipid kinase
MLLVNMPTRSRFHDAALIFNPLAGRRPWRRQVRLDRAVALLEASGIRISLVATQGRGSGSRIAREQIALGRDLIVVCGGDGTVNEVVNGMAGSSVPLALLPAGTANVLAKELDLPWDPWRAAEYIPAGDVRRVALGRAGGRYFITVGGAGSDANLIYHVLRRGEERWGMLAFWLEGFRQLLTSSFPEFTVEVEGESLSATLVVVSRTRHYGGPIQITPCANLFGDDFEVVVFPRRSPSVYWLYFLAQMVGQLGRFPELRAFRTRRVAATPRGHRIRAQVDGELAGELPIEFSINPQALSLLVPKKV